jgi:hypothetical protein
VAVDESSYYFLFFLSLPINPKDNQSVFHLAYFHRSSRIKYTWFDHSLSEHVPGKVEISFVGLKIIEGPKVL